MAVSTVKLNLSPFFRNLNRESRLLERRILKRSSVIYLTAMQRRFDGLSKGGSYNGEAWEPLAESTKARRRGPRAGHEGPRKFAILTDTGLLKRALLAGGPGNFIRTTGKGIKIGIGGGVSNLKARMTVGELAAIHHEGGGNLPARPVMTVDLEQQDKDAIVRDATAEYRKALTKAAIK